MTTENKYAAKIEALLRKAEGTDNPHEAETYTAKAEELMIRHGIEASMLGSKDGQQTNVVSTIEVEFTSAYKSAELLGAYAVVKALGLHAYRSKRAKSEVLIVVGYTENIAQAKTLIVSLTLQCVTARRAWWKTQRGIQRTGSQRFTADRSFITNFGAGAAERIAASRQRETVAWESEHGEGTLVVVQKKEASDIAAFMSNMRLRSSSSRGARADGSAGSAGRVAGQRAGSSQRASVSGGRKAIG